ncbi:MAG: cysteine--tRNA ligase [Chloroflexaceae bacterium]
MLLYNSRTARKDAFVIPADRPVKLYVCGVTPYDTTHMGHARTYLVFDVLLRYLRWRGATVHYCQNVTDVDDPLLERAARDAEYWADLAQRQLEQYVRDSAALNILPPTYLPKAGGEIDYMIAIVEQLIELGYGYVRGSNVYFRVAADPNFGAMARMSYAEMLATANRRGNNPHDPLKHDPLDFLLWQQSNPGDPTWPSPWGPGRPGWHIQCAAMTTHYFGQQIDIHGGGSDLLFPHHVGEIAQVEPVTGVRPFVNVWLHTGMVYLDGHKMSKSRGNLVFIRDALKEHDADTLRWYLLSVPYRQEFTYERERVGMLRQRVATLHNALDVTGEHDTALDLTCARQAFDVALGDNLNTPLALDILHEMAQTILTAASAGRDVYTAQSTLAELTSVLGLRAWRDMREEIEMRERWCDLAGGTVRTVGT